MRRIIGIICIICCCAMSSVAQKVTLHVQDESAELVFRDLMRQTGKNFVYSSDLLTGLRVTIDANRKPLKKVLAQMFRNSDIEYKIKGNDVMLKRKPKEKRTRIPVLKRTIPTPVKAEIPPTLLDEVVVVSSLEAPAVETAEIGAKKLTMEEILNTPTLFGEHDVIKALHLQPGITEGTEGMAGMNVHGGNSDENMYLLDNVPLYHANHFAGLFSAFNADAIHHIDFFKSSVPAKYDGRLSSFLDVKLRNGSHDGHHGSAKLGLTSGSFNVSGPIGKSTTYLLALRKSWYELLTMPIVALANSDTYEKIKFQYYFMDLNAKLTHKFSKQTNGFLSIYFGDDLLKTGSKDTDPDINGWYDDDNFRFHWGNLMIHTGINHTIRPSMTAEFSASYTRFFSSMKHYEYYKESFNETDNLTITNLRTNNNISDWTLRGDFNWTPSGNHHVRFGANYVHHSFLPVKTSRKISFNDLTSTSRDSTERYEANEFNAYIEDSWAINEKFRANIGIHASGSYIDSRLRHGIAPRASISYRPYPDIAVKAAYSRTTQYIHQLTQSYLALPTDQWIPITGNFKPQTADKISLGAYWQSTSGTYSLSAEGYYKWSHNLIEYKDEYYLYNPIEMWNSTLTTGHGTAKGIDLKVGKNTGKLTGHISYSLGWVDRTFKDKNGGVTYPARFDNRHTINIFLNWQPSDKVNISAAWTGHSGNKFTLMPQVWTGLDTPDSPIDDMVPLKEKINNYQLPFYHRLDLAITVKNRRGYWTYSFYNAYCHLNTVAIRQSHDKTGKPIFQKVKLLPIIPSISYTWLF